MAVSQVLGQTSFGYLSDRRISMDILAGSSTIVAAIAAYTCWGLVPSFNVLVAFSLIYGFFGAGYTALWVRGPSIKPGCTV
jgi:MFS family permease